MASTPVLPPCPDPLPSDLGEAVRQLASLWASHTDRPRIDKTIVGRWDRLIAAWIEEKQLPLFVRKYGKEHHVRGEVSYHKSGRALIHADNSPTFWSYALAYSYECPSVSDIDGLLGEIPIAFPNLTAVEKARSTYQCTPNQMSNPNDPNKREWKVCHKTKLGRLPGEIEQVPIQNIEKHFLRFISPSNIFLVPKKLAGLGELDEFCDAIGSGT
jgi:hypothetical protein